MTSSSRRNGRIRVQENPNPHPHRKNMHLCFRRKFLAGPVRVLLAGLAIGGGNVVLAADAPVPPSPGDASLPERPATEADPEISKPAPVNTPGKPAQKVDRIDVKSSRDSYDARREDTATKIVVTEEEIGKYGDTQLADVLKRLPGITVTGDSIRLRGLGSGYTQILLNGERAPPGFQLDTLSPALIERIEILRAATAEFSTQSIAGTINIVLKQKVTVSQREMKLGIASGRGYRAPSANLQVSDKEGAFSYSMGGYYVHSDFDTTSSGEEFGTDSTGAGNLYRATRDRTHGAHDRAGLSPRLNWTLANDDTINSQTFLNFSHSVNHGDWRYPVMIGVPVPYPVSLTRTVTRNTLVRSDLNGVHKLAEGARLDLKFGVTGGERNVDFFQQGYDGANVQNLDSTVRSMAKDSGATFTGKYSTPFVEGHALVAGWDGGFGKRAETRDQRDKPLPGVIPVIRYEEFAADVARFALFAQDEWSISKDWSVYAGLRWEMLDTKSDGSTFSEVHNRSNVVSPLFQTLWKFPDSSGRQVRFALTRTYKAPSTASLIPRRFTSTNNSPTDPDYQGNPNLRPELATGIDIAYEHFREQGAMLSVSGSMRRITDFNRRGLVTVDNRWVSTPINDGTAHTASLELDAKFPVQSLHRTAPPIDFRLNLNRNWSTVDSVPGPNNRLDQQTPFSATIGLDYRMKGGDVTAGGSYSFKSGGPVRTSVNQSQYLAPRRELDVYGLWKFTPRMQIRLTLANMLRQDYSNESSYFDESGSLRRTSTYPSSMHVRVNLEMKY